MGEELKKIVISMGNQSVAYLPKLVAGIVVIVAGLVAGWFVKRMVTRMALLLNVDRFLLRFYRRRLSLNNEVRQGLYNVLGNIAAGIVFLVFLDFALITWDLDILSRVLEKVILVFPRIITSGLIFGFGWLISRWASRSLQTSLDRETIPHSTLIALYARVLTILFFSALAAFEMDLSPQIVIIAFSTIYVTLGVIAVALVASGITKAQKKKDDSGQ